MVRFKLKGINRVKKTLSDGAIKKFYYHRATGIRLPDDPHSEEFLEAYHTAQVSIKSTNRNRGTLKAIIQQYQTSPDFTEKRDRTRKDYLSHIAKIEKKFGNLPIPALNYSHIRADFLKWRDQLAKKSKRQADYTIAVLSLILSWALNRNFIEANHIYKPGRTYHANRSEKIWLPENVSSFLAKATPEIAFALILARDTGQRQGDLLKLTWAEFDGKYINVTQSKTKVKVSIPATNELKRILKQVKAKRKKSKVEATTILTRPDGQPWKADHFRHEWRRITKEAGLNNLTFNDLRGTTVTALADADCTIPQISSITGHSPKSAEVIIGRYLARTHTQADAAIVKLENARRTKPANRPANRGKKGKVRK